MQLRTVLCLRCFLPSPTTPGLTAPLTNVPAVSLSRLVQLAYEHAVPWAGWGWHTSTADAPSHLCSELCSVAKEPGCSRQVGEKKTGNYEGPR